MSLTFPEDRTYHAGHLWAKDMKDGSCLVGITDFAQDQLGRVVFVELPKIGDHFAENVSCASLESIKLTSEALMPLSGRIVAVNQLLLDEPELLNTATYEQGWLVRVQPDNPAEACRLSATEYQKLIV